MKVITKPYTTYYSIYGVVESIFAWSKHKDNIAEMVSDSKFGKLFNKLMAKYTAYMDKKRIQVKLHDYDTWSMDSTLAYIVVPMLKQLKNTKHGAPASLPEFAQTSEARQMCFDFYKEGDDKAFEQGQQSWNNILEQMIWSFEQFTTDWETQYHSGISDVYFEKVEDGFEMKRGPNDTHKFDYKGYDQHREKIQAGLDLFAKYYENLWD